MKGVASTIVSQGGAGTDVTACAVSVFLQVLLRSDWYMTSAVQARYSAQRACRSAVKMLPYCCTISCDSTAADAPPMEQVSRRRWRWLAPPPVCSWVFQLAAPGEGISGT